MSPELGQFREWFEKTPANQVDTAYRHFAAALPERVSDFEYQDFVKQMQSEDPNQRANGFCGVAAAKTPASLNHLLSALPTESDPFNRTMLVWCLRLYESDRHVAPALEQYIATCKDIDLQRCLDPAGKVLYGRFPPPLSGAAYEAFKSLLATKGRETMLNGAGWRLFSERFERQIDIQPAGSIDMSRFQPDRPRSDPQQKAKEWIEEMQRW